MKTNKITLALLLAISIVTFSCKKEGSKIKKEGNVVKNGAFFSNKNQSNYLYR